MSAITPTASSSQRPSRRSLRRVDSSSDRGGGEPCANPEARSVAAGSSAVDVDHSADCIEHDAESDSDEPLVALAGRKGLRPSGAAAPGSTRKKARAISAQMTNSPTRLLTSTRSWRASASVVRGSLDTADAPNADKKAQSGSDVERQSDEAPLAKRPRATPKKRSRKSASKPSEPSALTSSLTDDSKSDLEPGTWADIARLEEDDSRPPTVFGLIPFSPEPEGQDAAMSEIDELASDKVPTEPGARDVEMSQESSSMPIQTDVSPVKSDVEAVAISTPRVPTSRSSIKTERMSPSVLFSPDPPPPAPLPIAKAPRLASSSPLSTCPSDMSSDAAGLSALVPSPRQTPSRVAGSSVAQRGSVEFLLDKFVQDPAPTFATSSQPSHPPASSSSWSHSLAGPVPIEASSSRLPAVPRPPVPKAYFRVISRPTADVRSEGSNTATPALATVPLLVDSHLATSAIGLPDPAARGPSRKRLREDSPEDADEATVTAKLEEAIGEIPLQPRVEDQTQLKVDKQTHKADRAAQRDTKRQKHETAVMPAAQCARPAADSPSLPSPTDLASVSAAERIALVRSKLQQWVSLQTKPKIIGRAIVAWLGEYQMSGLRMLLLRDLFTLLLDLNVHMAREICWSIIRLSGKTPGLLADPPRNAFQRWLLQDIREADRELYASRVPIYSELFALDPPHSYKTCLDQHLARLTGSSPPTVVDLDAFRTLITSRLGALESLNLLAPAFDKLRAIAASPHLGPKSQAAIKQLLLLDTHKSTSSAAGPASSEHSVVVRRVLAKLDWLNQQIRPTKDKGKGSARGVCSALMAWIRDARPPLHASHAPEAPCLVTLALDRAHPFFQRPRATNIFFELASTSLDVASPNVHKALCDAIVTSDPATYVARLPIFSEMLVATKKNTFIKAFIDCHLRRVMIHPHPPQDVIANLIDVIRPVGLALDQKRLLVDVFDTLRKLRDENRLDIGSKMLINDLIFLRKSSWKIVPH